MLDADFEVRRRQFPVALRLQLEPGQRLSVLGRSGAGKTTALEALAGLLPLQRGWIRLAGTTLGAAGQLSLPPGRRGVALLRQRPGLFPHLTVLDNIRYPAAATEASARSTAGRLGLTGVLQARPGALSGGEAQRVALARALQTRARLLCLDEPFNSLDRPLARELLDLVVGELEGAGTAAILVTHQLAEAQAFADRLMVLDRGMILQVSQSREVVLNPASRVVAELVGYRGGLRHGAELMLVHPELARPRPGPTAPGRLSARVLGQHPQGGRMELELAAGGAWQGRFSCLVDEPVEDGTELVFDSAGTVVFAAEGEQGDA